MQLVADREHVTWSEALRRLLALGAKADMEAHLDSHTPPRSVRSSDDPRDERETPPAAAGERGLGGGSSDQVPRLPATKPTGLGDAIRHIYDAGLNPTRIEEDPGAA